MSKIVMRCRHCQLNQFAAATGDCRRCHRPLFSIEVSPTKSVKKAPPARLAGCLRMIREFRHMSQIDVANKLERPRSWISKLENGVRPNMATVFRLAGVYEVPAWVVVEPDPIVIVSYFHVRRMSEAEKNDLLKWAELRAA